MPMSDHQLPERNCFEMNTQDLENQNASSLETGDTWFLSGQIDSAGPVRRVVINSNPFIVGRRSDASLRLDHGNISKNHAKLEARGNELFLEDMGSTNGTYVGGQRIEGETVVNEGDLIQFSTVVLRVGCDRKDTMGHNTVQENVCDQALAMMQFDRLINDGEVLTYGQPIYSLKTMQVEACEILGRSRLFGLRTPSEMFNAAVQLSQVAELSERFRTGGLESAVANNYDYNLFLNTHPTEVGTQRLIDSLFSLRRRYPNHRLTLEIHEAAVTNSQTMSTLRSAMTELDIQLAFDDFGVGRARLVELSEMRPDYLKFDMKLTRHMHKASLDRQKLVQTLVGLVQDMGIVCLAEGVETEQGHEVLREMGFELGQGFYYARPAPFDKLVDPDHE